MKTVMTYVKNFESFEKIVLVLNKHLLEKYFIKRKSKFIYVPKGTKRVHVLHRNQSLVVPTST
jgi:hypothetical protein